MSWNMTTKPLLSYFPSDITSDTNVIITTSDTTSTITTTTTTTTSTATSTITTDILSPINNDDNSNNNNNDDNINNYFNSKQMLDTEDFTQDMFFYKYVRYLNEEKRAPALLVFDFDNTLAIYDEQQHLQLNLSDSFPSVYTRPFLYEMLDYMKATNKHNILILWTAGKRSYIQNVLTLLNMCQYFTHILTYYDCVLSKNKYGVSKSYKYIVNKYPKYSDMRAILIDNWAVYNALGRKRKSYKTNYDDGIVKQQYSRLISIKPYTIYDVVKEFGAFNIPPHQINDIDMFIRSKGLNGKTNNNYNHNNGTDSSTPGKLDQYPSYGDTALLSLICFCEREIFGIVATPTIQNKRSINSDYYIIMLENDQLSLINRNKVENSNMIRSRQCRPLIWIQIST